jgi:signal transduction histidine kinase
MRLRSLSSRLIVYAAVGSVFGFFVLPTVLVVGSTAFGIARGGRATLDDLTVTRARDVVAAAVRLDERGEKYVAMTDELKALLHANPDFRYAAFEPRSGKALPGSTPGLAHAFESVTELTLFKSIFYFADGDKSLKGESFTLDLPVGEVGIATCGTKFHWDDIFYFPFQMATFYGVLFFLPQWAGMCLVALVVVNRGLAPLRTLAAELTKIDVNSLKECISSAEAPSETAPFVEAVNKAFERVHEGVERQRRFTANSAHELRTPITILRARVGKMEGSPLKFEIERDVLRMQMIVEQMLLLAQIKERGRIEPEIIDLYEVALAVAADYVPIALDDERDIQFEATAHPVLALGLKWGVDSIVSNLIANAVRVEPKGGAVIVRVLSECAIEVIDHGSGVGRADRARIFEPFWRKDDATPGTGLGLSIVRELVELHDGEIGVCDTPGGGATFKVRLPEAKARRLEGAAPRTGRAVSLDQRFERNT